MSWQQQEEEEEKADTSAKKATVGRPSIEINNSAKQVQDDVKGRRLKR